MSELEEFRAEVASWLEENRPQKPNFLLPETFMEVGSDEQFHYLRDWQQKVYEAGYLGMTWPEEYGGYGKDQVFQDIVDVEMRRLDANRAKSRLQQEGANLLGVVINKEK